VIGDTIRVVVIVINRVFVHHLQYHIMSRYRWNCRKANAGAI
ncbi:23863_t:CDS:1, partial [Racocetra persica]